MPLTADGWTLYHFRITVFGTPESYRQLQHYDFSRFLATYRNNNAQLQSTLAQQASRAAPPTTPDQIIIDDYSEMLKKVTQDSRTKTVKFLHRKSAIHA